ncbi:MAG: type IV toxin-antitoxin system AbiEi family antitoxin domain-containing protein [Chlamydiia bacterium]
MMSEALALGIHRRELYALRDRGDLEVLNRGLFRLTDMPAPFSPDFITVTKRIPKGIICLISALSFHELTTQIPHSIYVAMPAKGHRPSLSHPPMRHFWYGKTLLETGVVEHLIDGCTIRVFDIEKTLVDCVKFRNKIGQDVVLEALNMYWRRRGPRLDLLFRYAKLFRVDHVMRDILEPLVAGQ